MRASTTGVSNLRAKPVIQQLAESGLSKSFNVRILAQSYQAKREHNGDHRDQYYGINLSELSTDTGDGSSEIAVTVAMSSFQRANGLCTDWWHSQDI